MLRRPSIAKNAQDAILTAAGRLWLLTMLAAGAIGAEAEPVAGTGYENLALGKPYVLHPRPNYQYTRNDPHVGTRLTDGEYTDVSKGQFWVQPTTVGWAAGQVEITLDLGEDYAIRGLSFSSVAGGGADVELPKRVEILVSVDGRRYHLAGDLVQMDPRPRPAGYNVPFRFETDQLTVHGQYVKLIVHRGGRLFIFVDEIEILRGVDAWMIERPMPGPAIEYPMTLLENPFSLALKGRLDRDLAQARSAIRNASVADEVRDRLLAETDVIQQDLDATPEYESSKGFSAVFPLNAIHARTYALHGSLREALGHAALIVWRANPWDFLRPVDLPEAPPAPRIEVAAMRGETRAGAVNLTNCTDEHLSVHMTRNGLPSGAMPAYVTVREVAWTGTFRKIPIAAALPLAERDGQRWRISVPAGMTRQVWFEVAPRDVPAGKHTGEVVFTGEAQQPVRVPFALRVFDLDFPAEPTLHLGGFDYTDRPGSSTSYGVTHANVDAFIAHLRERYVDTPWASTWVMPHGSFHADGTYKVEPDTALFDAWIRRWPGARRYGIYNFVPFWKGKIAGTAADEPLFAAKVGAWIRFWVSYARTRGIDPSRLLLHLVDEPHRRSDDRMFIDWAKAIHASEPDVVVWVDPFYKDPTEALPEVWSAADVICPLRGQMLRYGEAFETFYRKQRETGKQLEFYTIANVVSDPYAAYRLPAWTCFDAGAVASFFWAFGDNGGGTRDSWNQYAADTTACAPLFLAPNSVTAGKHMEAVREGVQDFEYLVMLRDRVGQLSEGGSTHALLPQANALLDAAAERVLKAQGASQTKWQDPKDRSIADTVRVEIGEMLEDLQ